MNGEHLLTSWRTLAVILAGISVSTAEAGTLWTKNIDPATYGGAYGTITFDDWGYTGPGGRTAQDFAPLNGGFGEVGQIQHVVTRDADWNTPDAPYDVIQDVRISPVYRNANMDGNVNFYKWGYTTVGGSRFSNMMIDKDGDYFIAKDDMNFEFYDLFRYRQVGNTYQPGDPDYVPDGEYMTNLAFQPYALSDAEGWCGSVLASNPGALEPMAGQVQFDFAFDVYTQYIDPVTNEKKLLYMSTEIVPSFEMRSYGDITVDVTTAGGDVQQFSARAVINNTNPASVDPATNPNPDVTALPGDIDYYNLVSFMGAGVIPNIDYCGRVTAEWAAGQRGPGVKKFASIIPGVADAASCAAAGGEWQKHAFSGFAFILRADGTRVIEAMDYSTYSDLSNVPYVSNGVAYNYDENGNLVPIADLSAVPVPAAVWLFGSGLAGLMGAARRKKAA